MTALGAYFGNDPTALADYETWLGRKVDNVLFYLNDWTWKDFDSSIGWAAGLWKPSGRPVIWSVPLTVSGTSLAAVATGDYNGHFLKAAQALALSKPSADGAIYVRVGWEFNGSWMPWSARGKEGDFIDAYRELVDTFRSVSSKFKFVWDVNATGDDYNPEAAYPGDRYVDVVGMDFYYNKEWDNADPLKAFQSKVTMNYGLQWQQDFAAAHGKATAISEWGVKTDDSGPFVVAAAKWMKDHNMLFQNYWESDYANYDGRLRDDLKPHVGDLFKDLFVATPRPGIEVLPAAITGVSASGPGVKGGTGILTVGETATLTLTLSKAVTVANAAKLSLGLNDGGRATFDAAASDATHLVFRHVVKTDQVAADFAVTRVSLNGASIRDAAGASANLEAAVANPTGVLRIDGHTGSDDRDVFRGTAKADTFRGNGGDDLFHVNHVGDRVVELRGDGTDTVLTSVSFTLASGQEIEKLATADSAAKTAIHLTGNVFSQTLVGNNGNNVLNGGGGADKLHGYGGNDTYVVDHPGDRVIEAAGRGFDTVLTSVDYALQAGQEIEILATTNAAGRRAISLIGNAYDQTIRGNAGDNVIDGKAGADILRGDAGRDTFVFSTKLGPSNVDCIQDFSAKDDTIALENAIFTTLTKTGTLSSAAFKDITDGAKLDADDRILYNHDTGRLSYDADGSGATKAVTFAILDTHPTLTFQDFIVV